MSLSTLATTSFSSAHDADLPPSASELRNVLLDYDSVDMINHVFDNNALSLALLRHANYTAHNITRLQAELDRHEEEERNIYEHIMHDDQFRHALQPVIHGFRRRSRAKGFHPYNNRPLSPTPPPLSPPSKSRRTDPSSSSTSDSSTSYDSGMSIVNAYLKQEQQQQQPGSSPQYPIVIDISDEEERPVCSSPRPSSKSPKQASHEHCQDDVRPRLMQPTCEQCGQYGHEKPNCDTPARIYLRCEFCFSQGQSQRLCMHYNMSKKRRRYLRQQMGLPENSD